MLRLKRFAQITNSHCGPASLKMLYARLGYNFTQPQITSAAKAQLTVKKYGVRPDQLAQAVERLTPELAFWSKQHTKISDVEKILHHHHWPVGINWQNLFYDSVETEAKEDPYGDHGHYVVLVNINPAKNQIAISDPYRVFSQVRHFSLDWFQSRWYDRTSTPLINQRTQLPIQIETHRFSFLLAPKTFSWPKAMGFKHSIMFDSLVVPNSYDLPQPTATRSQPVKLRFFRPFSISDYLAIRSTLKDPRVGKWMENVQTTSFIDYLRWARDRQLDALLYAATDPLTDSVLGFIYFYSGPEEKLRFERLEHEKIIQKMSKNTRYLEISFAKKRLNQSEISKPGVMSAGVIYACQEIIRHYSQINLKVRLIAYINPQNQSAIKLVRRVGFKYVGKSKYDTAAKTQDLVFLFK